MKISFVKPEKPVKIRHLPGYGPPSPVLLYIYYGTICVGCIWEQELSNKTKNYVAWWRLSAKPFSIRSHADYGTDKPTLIGCQRSAVRLINESVSNVLHLVGRA